MSIELMSKAMQTALPASQKLVLIIICDRANDQGGSIWESVGEIARKSSLSDRQVQRTLRGFEAGQLLRVTGNPNGGAPGMSRRYRIDVQVLAGLVEAARADESTATPMADDELIDVTLHGGETGDTMSPVPPTETGDIDDRGVTPMSPLWGETGDTHVTLSISNTKKNTNIPHTPVAGGKSGLVDDRNTSPSDEVVSLHKPRVVKQAICLKTWLAECKAAGHPPIKRDDAVWAYAETCGIPADFIGLAWAEFKRRRADSGKRQKDWPRTFRNCVEGNWFRLWWTNGQAYALTTQGQQAQALHREARAAREAAAAAGDQQRAA